MCQGSDALITDEKGATEMKLTTVGIDLAKNVFQVHGVDERGKTVLQAAQTESGVGVLRAARAVSDRDGGVCGSALLGTRVDDVGA
jgi:hypothetical protein